MAVERLAREAWTSPWREEHEARYLWASAFTRGARVLDIACGSGFGGKILLESGAAHLVSADLSDEALAATGQLLEPFGKRAEVRREDALDLTFPDRVFDVVTSMETLEHLPDAGRFLSEVHRVLKPGGLLALSTPNALVTLPENGKPINPFHLKEFTPKELHHLLLPAFRIKEASGQHLPPEYGVAPFLPSFKPEELDFKGKVGFLFWRVILRMGPMRDVLHRAVSGYSFYPRAEDYTFEAGDLERAHVQVVLAQKVAEDAPAMGVSGSP